MNVVAAPAPLIVIGEVISKSPPAFAFSFAATRVSVYVPAGKTIMSAPASAFASVIAALSVQTPLPAAVSQTPFPGLAS